jgi:hypothetical protein
MFQGRDPEWCVEFWEDDNRDRFRDQRTAAGDFWLLKPSSG